MSKVTAVINSQETRIFLGSSELSTKLEMINKPNRKEALLKILSICKSELKLVLIFIPSFPKNANPKVLLKANIKTKIYQFLF